jgi:hypothetical protein
MKLLGGHMSNARISNKGNAAALARASPVMRSPGLHTPRPIRAGHFLWHNHIMHCEGMGHGVNGFRYWFSPRPINYRQFMRCNCGVTPLPHYSVRDYGAQKCVTFYKICTKAWGMTAKQARNAIQKLRSTEAE